MDSLRPSSRLASSGSSVDPLRASRSAARRRLELVARGGADFARLSYSDAVRLLGASGHAFRLPPPRWGQGLANEHERWLAEHHCGGAPVFVTDYPAAIKPFYMRGDGGGSGDGGCGERATVEAFDLLVPGIGELAGGSAREERLEVLAPRMRALGLLSPAYCEAMDAAPHAAASPPAEAESRFLDWYLDLRKFGGAPHAGFGLGFERLVMFATGVENARDAIAVPRVPGSCRM